MVVHMSPDWLDQARVLRDGGMTYTQIKAELGIPQQRLSEWLSTNNHCVGCGTLILARRDRCYPCNVIASKRWTTEAIIRAIQEWADEHGEPPAMPDWDSWQSRNLLADHERAERRDSEGNRWPWPTAVVRAFGSWNAGVRAAGFEPRAPHGVSANAYRRRVSRAKAARA